MKQIIKEFLVELICCKIMPGMTFKNCDNCVFECSVLSIDEVLIGTLRIYMHSQLIMITILQVWCFTSGIFDSFFFNILP